MRNYADAVNLHARIHALRSRLLTLRDYASMVRGEQVNSFRLTAVQNTIEAKENLFRQQIAPVIGITEAHDRYTPLFLAYLRQFEVNNAKLLLAGAAGLESEKLWYNIGSFAVLDAGLLKEKLSPAGVKSLIAGTYLDSDFKDTSSYRQMGIRADICAARNFFRSANLLSGQAKEDFQDMVQRRVAVLTVMWSYRLRSYYRYSDEKVRSYMQGFHELLGGSAQSRIRSEEDALNRSVNKMRRESGQEPSMTDIERYLEKNYFVWISSMFHRDFHSIYCVLAYLWLLFYQIRNLFRIIDGWRFGFPAEAILDRLICAA